jgi:hypothetical protein
MSKRSKNENNYPFYCLDKIIEVTLNPAKTNIENLTPENLQSILEQLPIEINRIADCLKQQSFCLYQSEAVSVIAGHYDQAIRSLQLQAQDNLQQYPKRGPLRQTGELIIRSLDEFGGYLHKRYDGYLSGQPPKQLTEDPVQRATFKVLCKLSVDQIGLILKAADDLKLIIARSMSQIYKTIVPYLSTSNKKDISWDSMRSSTYHPEETDKAAAISALEKLIEKIKEYR